MKRTYIQPQMIAVKLQNQSHLMENSTLSNVSTNLSQSDNEHFNYNPRGTNSNARVKESDIWDEEW